MHIIATEPATKRARNSGLVLTDRHCQKRVGKRLKNLRPQMSRPLCQHYHRRGGDLRLGSSLHWMLSFFRHLRALELKKLIFIWLENQSATRNFRLSTSEKLLFYSTLKTGLHLGPQSDAME
jgi:hypothetical protein